MKKRKVIIGALAILVAISILGGFILEKTGYESPSEVAESAPEKEQVIETNAEESVSPLSKEEVLAKFALDSDIEPYIDAPFTFVGSRTDTADYYSLADTDKYRNASVIFKDGEIASVKLIPEGNADPAELFAEFGITDEPRELSGAITAYEVALIPMYWSQNIERYPFELD